MLLGFQTWSLNFFFVNFDFSYFFVFFENEQYQRRLDEENPKNINSFLDDVENAKMTKIY
jgi:hypothetical protein